LPAQTEVNLKQCGAISSSESITTRNGKSIEPLLKIPTKFPCVPPRTRNSVQTSLQKETEEKDKEPETVIL
jgi:hypothetical protein